MTTAIHVQYRNFSIQQFLNVTLLIYYRNDILTLRSLKHTLKSIQHPPKTFYLIFSFVYVTSAYKCQCAYPNIVLELRKNLTPGEKTFCAYSSPNIYIYQKKFRCNEVLSFRMNRTTFLSL